MKMQTTEMPLTEVDISAGLPDINPTPMNADIYNTVTELTD